MKSLRGPLDSKVVNSIQTRNTSIHCSRLVRGFPGMDDAALSLRTSDVRYGSFATEQFSLQTGRCSLLVRKRPFRATDREAEKSLDRASAPP